MDAHAIYELVGMNSICAMREYFRPYTKEEIAVFVNTRVNGTTALIRSCRMGFVRSVMYLIVCGANVDLKGKVSCDGETIEDAPPIWCAAAAGFLDIVEILYYAGADIDSTTYTNSTPLRAACFDGHYKIVKFLTKRGANIEIANRHGHTCLMIASYKGYYDIAQYLIQLGADVNRKSLKGNTALHDCAESGNLNILKLLLDNGAVMVVDCYNMTPLLAASVTGHSNIVDYIINNCSNISRQEIIDALELLGATYVDKELDVHAAISSWAKAMSIRYDPHHATILKPVRNESIAAYNYAREVQSESELNELLYDPDELRMQALLVRERILGPAHPDTSYYVRHRGGVYADNGRFDRCFELWNYALDMQQKTLVPLSSMTQSSFYSFVDLFSLMLSNNGDISRGVNVDAIVGDGRRRMINETVKGIAKVLKKAIAEIARALRIRDKPGFSESGLERMVGIALYFISLIVKKIPHLSRRTKREASSSIRDLVCLNLKVGAKKSTLLHLACTKDKLFGTPFRFCMCPTKPLIRQLYLAGADVRIRDADGNTPLHLITAIATDSSVSNVVAYMIRHLLNFGSHLDWTNNDGKSAIDLLSSVSTLPLSTFINPVKYTTLMCLAARVIRKHAIAYDEAPVHLHEFIRHH